jgi:hypothetical protein
MRWAIGLTIGLLAFATAASGKDPSAAGAYCPFPEPGQKPACLAPVQEKYPEFLSAADSGQLDDAGSARVEADLANAATTQDAYLALSSLAYAYYRLAQFEAADPGADPGLVARLEDWNQTLSTVYHDASADPAVRSAVLEAATDLHARAPAVDGECEAGQTGSDCNTTGELMLALRSADDFSERQGMRGALSRLLSRMLGRESSESAP